MAGSSQAASGRIFISYRRDETAYPAGWLFDRLANRYGRGQVFKDVDSIQLGDDFVEVITSAVGSCDVLLALIGDRWLTITDEDGRRRLDNPDDFVRLEIEAALTRGVRVIPILVDRARMPRAAELPPTLAKLVRRQALELSPSRFDFDTSRLLNVLDQTLAEEQARRDTEARARHEAEAQAKQKAEEGIPSEAVKPARVQGQPYPLVPSEAPDTKPLSVGRLRRWMPAILVATVITWIAIAAMSVLHRADGSKAMRPLPSTTQPVTVPSALVGNWEAHAAVLNIQSNGDGKLEYRTYTDCGPDVPPPCDNTEGNQIIWGGKLTFRVVRSTGTTAQGKVLSSTNPDQPAGSMLKIRLLPDDQISVGGLTLCGPKAPSGACGA